MIQVPYSQSIFGKTQCPKQKYKFVYIYGCVQRERKTMLKCTKKHLSDAGNFNPSHSGNP